MEGYYSMPHVLNDQPVASHHLGASLPSNGYYSDYRGRLDTSPDNQLSGQYNHDRYRNPIQPPTLPNSQSSGIGPDPDFVQSLRSIRATQSSPRQGRLSGSSGASESEAVVAETIVRARKSWKTVKGRNEPVWPPELEKILVQGTLYSLIPSPDAY